MDTVRANGYQKFSRKRIYEMKWNETEKKQLIIFALTAFGLPILLGIIMGISYYRGNDVTPFPNAQMYYPAAGVMLAVLLTKKEEDMVPKKFYTGFLITTVVMIATAVISVFIPQTNWIVLGQIPLIVCTIICWILLLMEKKEAKVKYGLQFSGRKSWLYVLLFFILYVARYLAACLIEGQFSAFAAVFTDPFTYVILINLVISFFLAFTAFFGEEYGWRHFFQPLLQKRFGLKGGVLILGVLWGFWHLPINIFYYSPDTWIISVALQLITCISLAVFFGYGYMKTGNVWVPVIMHFINNNMIAVLSGTADISGQVYRWSDIPTAIIINLVFIVFLFSGVYKEKNNL